jgi:hypothetical protein
MDNKVFEYMKDIEKWSSVYEFSFQFWGEGQNNVYINKDDVEVASYGGENTAKEIMERTLEWCEKANPRIKYPSGLKSNIKID